MQVMKELIGKVTLNSSTFLEKLQLTKTIYLTRQK